MGYMAVRFVPAASTLLFGIGVEVSGVEIPWLGYSLMGAAFLLLGIPAWFYRNQIPFRIGLRSPIVRNRPPREENHTTPPAHHYVGVLRTMRGDDLRRPMDMLRVTQVGIDWKSSALGHGAFLDFTFLVYSAAIHTLHFEGGCNGELFYISDRECGAIAAGLTAHPVDASDTRARITNLSRGHEAELRLHQYLTETVQVSLMGHVGKEVSFDFKEVRVPMPTWMVSEGGTNDPGPVWDVGLPPHWTVIVPDILDLITPRQ